MGGKLRQATGQRGDTTIGELIENYEAILLDAYGVLLHQVGPLPGAPALIGTLNAMRKPYFILTNDASRSPESASHRYHAMGLAIPPERVITSGSLIPSYFETNNLRGSRCVVLGPEDSLDYVADAGGEVVEIAENCDPAVVVVCDERGFPFLETVEAVISAIFHRVDEGGDINLVLANPDLIFPRCEGSFGLTAGSIALVIEAALAMRYPMRERYHFVPLGKPHEPIFAEALRRSGTRNMVMIGDQLGTDIRGAHDFGIDSALMPTGLTHLAGGGRAEVTPTFVLPTLVFGR